MKQIQWQQQQIHQPCRNSAFPKQKKFQVFFFLVTLTRIRPRHAKKKHKNKIFIKSKSNDVIRERSENKKRFILSNTWIGWMKFSFRFLLFLKLLIVEWLKKQKTRKNEKKNIKSSRKEKINTKHTHTHINGWPNAFS